MRIKLNILLVLLSAACLADWTDSNVSDALNHLTQIKGYINTVNTNLVSQKNDVSAIASDVSRILYDNDRVSWKTFLNNQYLQINSIADGEEYQWKTNLEGSLSGLDPVDPWSQENLTFFEQNDYARDNTSVYAGNILGYFSQNHNISFSSSSPDQGFLSYPEYGNVSKIMADKMTSEGFGIDDIKNSTQTQELREKISMIDDAANLMFTDNYDNAYINWDFSGIGSFLVNMHVMANNPFSNLKGRLRIKPVPGDYHYAIWHNYFDASYSNTAVVFRTCINICFYIAFALYVMNDLMSIVDA